MINEKLMLLNLSNEERKKAEDKFLVTLALLSIEELKNILGLLQENNVYVTKAREIKIFGNSKEEINKKFSILNELGEISIYKQDPIKINFNVIDIYKKVKYCKQIGKSYTKDDGTYEKFLFDDQLWQQEIKKEVVEEPIFVKSEEEIMTMEPEFSSVVENKKYTDINEYIKNDSEKIVDEPKPKTFDVIQNELETQNLEENINKLSETKTALEDFQKQLSELDTISFDELDFGAESFGGR